MLGTLDDLGDWRLQMGIWKYAIIGKILDQDALVAEYGHQHEGGFWDQTRADLTSSAIDRGRGWEPAPDWWAFHHLPWSWREQAHENDGFASHSEGETTNKAPEIDGTSDES